MDVLKEARRPSGDGDWRLPDSGGVMNFLV
jgi:hypothetical protein